MAQAINLIPGVILEQPNTGIWWIVERRTYGSSLVKIDLTLRSLTTYPPRTLCDSFWFFYFGIENGYWRIIYPKEA